MQPVRSQQRAPGSFSPLPGSVSSASTAAAAAASSSSLFSSPNPSRPQIRRIDTSESDDTISLPKTRGPQSPVTTVTSPSYSSSPHNFSRPTRPSIELPQPRTSSPLTLPPTRAGHARKHSQTQGHFEPTLPSTSTSNLSHVAMAQVQAQAQAQAQAQSQSQPAGSLSASQIAAQAAVMQHQQHSRHRSQTVPFPGSDSHDSAKRPGPKPVTGHRSPPMLSLTEASAPRDNGFGAQGYHNGLLGSHAAAATAAANVVFPRSPQPSPGLPPPDHPAPAPPTVPEKPAKAEKSKVKLFSRPKKIDTKGDVKERPLPSPGKIGSALASLQRANFSTTSLADSSSFYSLGNSSAATIRPVDSFVDRDSKEKDKEKKHHFLSRQKHKLSSKDDYHLPLSSAASNSRPVDPNAPSSLYNFNIPPSPGPNNNIGKSVSGLDLRHGGRALRDKKKDDNESSYGTGSEWPGPGSFGSAAAATHSYLSEPIDSGKYGLHNMSLDDAWPYLRAKLLVIFEGEDLRLPVEDFNRVVSMHIQYCIQRRSAHIIVDDLRDLLSTGFASLDHTLRKTPEDRLIPSLVELWIFTFTSILPYMQAVFLPLDLEFSGSGTLLTPEQARDFWGGVIADLPTANAHPNGPNFETHLSPASNVLDVRRLVLISYRDSLILPRYEKLKTIFSRLSLEHLPSSLSSLALASPPLLNDSAASLSTSPSDGFSGRPGTAMSLDPSIASYNSTSTTVFGNDSNPSRSRAISNVSFGSGVSDPASTGTGSLLRPFTPQMRDNERGGREILGSVREQNVEDSKQVTEMVGRMLQCMSVLASVDTGNNVASTDEASKMVAELGRLLKLNWLGRGRTGRNRRGMVGGRVKRQENNNSISHGILREGIREGVEVV
ncbi:HbrB-like protein [Annulohypoxylon truncatum]|uniref:HbrB-like protein n=1 Tax=Annulohypoxylon truncatum TaxID=327061 RepID=UPI00200773D6|nr:HbrB-like protein [Annulohypoxylon truncatum]KAI1206524.1 HbrB-like protein [Annulohypoxylon truncatum]